MQLTLENKVHAKYGDNVEIELKTSNFLLATVIIYGIPLATLLGSMFAVYFGFQALGMEKSSVEAYAAVIALICTALSFLVIRSQEKSIKKMKKFKPEVIRVVPKE